MELEILLRYVVQGLNDNVRPRDLVPSMLLFGALLTFPMTRANTPEQYEQITMIRTERAEVAIYQAEEKLITLLKCKVPPLAR